jgi:DNA-binding IclR family transcriptional regulator
MPYLEDLHHTTQETISMYLLDGDERVCIERLESPQNVRIVARIGRRLPLYAGSAGKAFLAFIPPERCESILELIDLVPFTKNTITDKEALRNELEIIRGQGYAFSRGEWTPEASGLAAPIFGQHEEVIAAISISGPTQRFREGEVREYCLLLKKAASQISIAMGSRTRSN